MTINEQDEFEAPEPIDYGFEAPEPIDYGFEAPEPIDYGFEAPEQPSYEFEAPEQPTYNFEAPEQPDTMQAYSSATLGDEASRQEGEREELTMELMKQIELAEGKSAEVAKLGKGIEGLENLEHQYANELDKYKEGKEF